MLDPTTNVWRAIDLTLIPYHGEPYCSPEEIYRGERKSGTSHFHAYATAYVVREGRRFFARKRSGWSEPRRRNAEGRLATVGICVVYGRFGKRGKRRRLQTFVYAYWGFRPASCAWVPRNVPDAWRMLLWLQHYAETLFGFRDFTSAERPTPP